MKNKNIKKIVVGSLVPSVLASCTYSTLFIQDDVVAINTQINDDEINNIAVPISLNLDAKDLRYLTFIEKLATDIIENPIIATQFIENPQKYLSLYEVSDLSIKIDDGLLKLIMALGDCEINEAIKSDNIPLFLSLCKTKGIFNEIKSSDLNNIVSIASQNEDFDALKSNDTSAFAVAVAIGAAVTVWVAAVTHAVVVNAATVATVVTAAAATVTVTLQSGSETQTTQSIINERDPLVYQLWTLKSENNETTIFLSEYENELINDLISNLQLSFPDLTEKDLSVIKQIASLELKNI